MDFIAPGLKIMRHPEIVEKLRKGEWVPPIHVEFDLTNRCNLSCKWCDFRHVHDGTDMPTPLAKNILRQLRDIGCRAVTFTGGGEPTLHPEFHSIVEYAGELGLDIGLYTNGVVGFQWTSLKHFKWVYVSLDECDRESYLVTKGVDRFDDVCRNVAWLAQSAPYIVSAVGLGFLLHGYNWHRVLVMEELGRKLGVSYVQFRPTVGLRHYHSWVHSVLDILDKTQAVYSVSRFMDMLDWHRDYEVCRGSELVPCIGADGTLWVCTNMRGGRALGDLKVEPLASIWARRPLQMVGDDCRIACRNHELNKTLEDICNTGAHDWFV